MEAFPLITSSSSSSDRERAIFQTITRGFKLTTQLQSLISCLVMDHPQQLELATVLSEQLLQALAAALSILNPSPNPPIVDVITVDVADIAATAAAADRLMGSPCSSNQRSPTTHDHQQGSFGDHNKPKSSPLSVRHQQGLKRNKRHPNSKTKLTTAPDADGHQWRKYGQKTINNFTYPRCYYRCTHKDDQECPATKVVQQKDSCEDPPMFIVTYNMEHKCKNTLIATPQLILDPSPTKSGQFSLTPSCGGVGQEHPLSPHTTVNGTPNSSAEIVSQQMDTSSTSNDHVQLTAPSTIGLFRMEEQFLADDPIGARYVFSTECPSPSSDEWVNDCLNMDIFGSEVNSVECF